MSRLITGFHIPQVNPIGHRCCEHAPSQVYRATEIAGAAAGCGGAGICSPNARERRKRDWRYSLLLPRVVGLNQQYIRARDAALVISQQCDPNRPVPRKPRKTRDF
jgi:hypothetical protein